MGAFEGPAAPPSETFIRPEAMEYKTLGNTGCRVPEIGLGTWQYTGGPEPLRRGIELGAYLVDTAEFYSTEGVVGRVAKGMRDRVFIATKVSPSHFRYREVLAAADRSLRLLGTDYIDLYQLHWPNPSIPIEETMGAMEALADAGKVRFIGVSNFSVAEFQEAQAALSKHPLVSNQVEYSLLHRHPERNGLLAACQELGVTLIAYSPLAQGILTGKYGPERPPAGFRRGRYHSKAFWARARPVLEALRAVAAARGKTPAQVALNWVMARGAIPIPGAKNARQAQENAGALGWRLTEEELASLDEAAGEPVPGAVPGPTSEGPCPTLKTQ